jgi:catechol 2,3-dioxygenase-like lactoylglutathione lyase family enzyme
MILGYDHVQLAMPAGGEATAREFYGDLLAMTEHEKPAALAVRGGAWFSAGTAVLHLGVEEPFRAARKAHPAFLVADLDELARRLVADKREFTRADGEIPGIRRLHTHDPFGNRLEFQQA